MRSGAIYWADRHWSVLITGLIRILSLSPAVRIQQSATLTTILTKTTMESRDSEDVPFASLESL